MDLGDMTTPKTDFDTPNDEGMPVLETADDDPIPSVNGAPCLYQLSHQNVIAMIFLIMRRLQSFYLLLHYKGSISSIYDSMDAIP